MTIRGNFQLFYFLEFFTGVLLIFLLMKFGDFGLIGISIFFIGLIITAKKDPDEREIFLSYKIGALESIFIGVVMTLIYFKFPEVNWFYALICTSLIARGIIGYLTFRFA